MARKLLHSFYLDPVLAVGLKTASTTEDRSQGEIVREAIRDWLDAGSYLPKVQKRKGVKRRK